MGGLIVYLLPCEQKVQNTIFYSPSEGYLTSQDRNTNPCYMSDLETEIPLRYLCTIYRCKLSQTYLAFHVWRLEDESLIL